MEFRDVVVDLSNVCHDADLPPRATGRHAVWGRFRLVLAAWRRDHPGAHVSVVADRVLKHELVDLGGMTGWRAVAHEFSIQEAAVADDLILEMAARDTALAVLSRDRFVDHRRRHPWIDREAHRFLSWGYGPDRRLDFSPSGIRQVAPYDISQAVERKRLKSRGLDPKRHRALLTLRWKCEGADCLHAMLWQNQLMLWPDVDSDGQAVCPGCGRLLVPLGPRSARQLVVTTYPDGREILRFPVEEDLPLTLGRGVTDCGIDLQEEVPSALKEIELISRRHVFLELDGATLRVVDLGSRNGSEIVRDQPFNEKTTPLVPDVPKVLGERDRLVLARCIQLRLSGQRFVPPAPLPGAAGALALPTVVG